MQIKGWVTYAQGWPTLPSLWKLILRASGLLLAAHSQCALKCLLSEITLLNQIMHASIGTSPARIFIDVFKSISAGSLFITDFRRKLSTGIKADTHIQLQTIALPLPLSLPQIWNKQYARWERRCDKGRASPGSSCRQRNSWMLRSGVRMLWWRETLESKGITIK